VTKDPKRAAEMFTVSADQGYSPAQVSLGAIFLDQGDPQTAAKYFDLAARVGSIEAFYYLAELSLSSLLGEESCDMANHYYKSVAEKAESIMSSFDEANAAISSGDVDLALLEDRRKLQAQVNDLQKKLATGTGSAAAEDINGIKLAARNLGEVPARDLKGLADAIGKQQGSGVVALVSTAEGKASIVVAVSPDLTGRISAVDLVRASAAAVGGKGGGGRPDLAQAGGPDGAKADEALAAVRAALV